MEDLWNKHVPLDESYIGQKCSGPHHAQSLATAVQEEYNYSLNHEAGSEDVYSWKLLAYFTPCNTKSSIFLKGDLIVHLSDATVAH